MNDTEKTIDAICAEVNNYFCRVEKITGEFTISGGAVQGLDGKIQEGQYFRIKNSVFNDGVYKYPATNLTAETFSGSIWPMAVPAAVMDLAAAILAWRTKYETATGANMSPFTSESFSKYSYSKGSGNASGSEDKSTWQGAFANQLNRYRRVRNIE